MDYFQSLVVTAFVSFVLGWLVCRLGRFLGDTPTARERDPRDHRILSLEAELKIASSERDRLKNEKKTLDKEHAKLTQLDEAQLTILADKDAKLARLKADLKSSVKMIRDLRGELSVRATEGVRSKVRMQEVETELSLAHQSTEMMATGVLDFDFDDESDDAHEAREAG